MNGVIETLKFTNSNGEKFNLYPRTLIECISNREGDSFEETLRKYVEDNVAEVVEDVVGDTYAEKTYVAEQIAAANHLTREIVAEVPTAETAQDNVIYMYKVDSASGNDVYQEYQLINGEVVLVGDTSIDLSNYVQNEELDKILDGTTTVGNSLQLGGKDASEYALAEELTKRKLNFITCATVYAINEAYEEVHNTAEDDTVYEVAINHATPHPIMGSGVHHVTGCRTNALYGWQIATSYNYNARFFRKLVNGTWGEWTAFATNLDLANYLSVVGARATNFYAKQMSMIGDPGIGFMSETEEVLQYLTYSTGLNGFRRHATNGTNYQIMLDTGNKPTGTYLGNGDATLKTINIGGIGDWLFIWNNYNLNNVIVGRNGAIGWDYLGNFFTIPQAEIHFAEGVLAIQSAKSAINHASAYFYYQVA